MVRPCHVRNAVQALIETDTRHDWSVDDVVAGLQQRGVESDFSSVFRGLVFLEAAGVIHRVELGDGKRRYEVKGPHHDHVRCDRCGAVAAIPECRVSVESAVVEGSSGYSISGHELLFRGLCGSCVSDSAPPASVGAQ